VVRDKLSTAPTARLPDTLGEPSPERVFDLAGCIMPWFASSAVLFCLAGLYIGFFTVPTDVQQGEVQRIMYLHAAAAWSALAIAAAAAALGVAGMLRGARLPLQLAEALVPTGALMSFLALWSASLWGKHAWGAWWVWDVHLVFALLIWVMYCAMIAVRVIVERQVVADNLTVVLALAAGVTGAANQLSVLSRTSAHQGACVDQVVATLADQTMVCGVVAMALGAGCYVLAAAATRLRCVILESELDSPWVILRRVAMR
jgi:heme exporter protein C